MSRRELLVIAGEVSGDMHAAALIAALRKRDPDLVFFGIGGSACREAGMEIVRDSAEMAVLGFAEVLRRYGFFRRVFNETVALAESRRPAAVVLIDYPGFNLRFAARAHAAGLKVIYYICPQVWAWKQSRIPRMASAIDRLITVFDFEKELFAAHDLRVDFVGHPLIAEARAILAAPEVDLPFDAADRVALLPGSRTQEVERILPTMLAAARLLDERRPGTSFVVAAPSAAVAAIVERVAAASADRPARWEVVTDRTRHVLKQSRAAMVASGTATLETTLMGCPMIVVYKVAPFTYWLGRMLIRVPHLGMVNVLAGEELCPEFIQGDADPERMAAAMAPLVDDTTERRAMLAGLERVVATLGEPGAEERAAEAVLEELA